MSFMQAGLSRYQILVEGEIFPHPSRLGYCAFFSAVYLCNVLQCRGIYYFVKYIIVMSKVVAVNTLSK